MIKVKSFTRRDGTTVPAHKRCKPVRPNTTPDDPRKPDKRGDGDKPLTERGG